MGEAGQVAGMGNEKSIHNFIGDIMRIKAAGLAQSV